jgi:hypothetical protein
MATYQVVNMDANIDTLLRLGLGEMNLLSYYRKVLKNPTSISWDNQSKRYLLRMFKIFRNIIYTNDQVYNKVKSNLVSGAPKGLKEAIQGQKIDYLMRLGWDDINFLSINRNIVLHPETAVNDPFKRKKIIQLFIKMRNMILMDPYIFERAKRMLKDKRLSFTEWTYLINRSERNQIDEIFSIHKNSQTDRNEVSWPN